MRPGDIDERLQAFQEGLFLAEIDLDREASTFDVTLAGPKGVFLFEWSELKALILCREPNDPMTRPSLLAKDPPLRLGGALEFAAEDEVEARIRVIDGEAIDDVLAAANRTPVLGEAADLVGLEQAWLVIIEALGAPDRRFDLSILVAAGSFGLHSPEGEIDLSSLEEHHDHDDGIPEDPPLPFAAPWVDLAPNDLPPELATSISAFFASWGAGDWRGLARVHPDPGRSDGDRERDLAAHFRDLWDFAYARRIDGHWIEGDVAGVAVRGVQASPADDEMPLMVEECVWSLALRRRRDGRWVVRNFAVGWPDSGSAPALPPEQKPWLAAFRA